MRQTLTIAKRELRSMFDTPIGYLLIGVFLVVLGWFFFQGFFIVNQASLRDMFRLAGLLMVFAAPLGTMRALAEEQSSGTLEILLTMPIRAWQAAVGKYVAALGFLLVAILFTLPYAFTVSSIGDLDWGATLAGYVGLILLASTYASVGIFASALSPNQIVGAVVGVMLCFVLFILGEVVPYVPPWAVGFAEYASVDFHLEGFAKGVVDTRDVIYFLSLTAFWLMTAAAVIEWRRLPTGEDLLGQSGHLVPLAGGAVVGALALFIGAGLASPGSGSATTATAAASGSAVTATAAPAVDATGGAPASSLAMLLVLLIAGLAFVASVIVLRRMITTKPKIDPKSRARWLAVRREGATNLVLLLGITLVLNFVSANVYARADWTENEENSLSEGSEALVANLSDRLFVTAYYDKEIPPPFNNHERFIRDLLQEYAAASNGRFRFRFVAPGDDKDLQAEARKAGITENQVQVIKEDKVEIAKVFMGLVFTYAGNTETWIPNEKDYAELEYRLSSLIQRLTTTTKKNVGFLTGHGEPNVFEAMTGLKAGLGHINLRPVDLTEGKTLPADIDALVIASPKSPLTEREKFELDQFIMSGKPVAFMYEGMGIEPKNRLGTALDVGLTDLMTHYGVWVRPDTVLDVNAQMIPLRTDRGTVVLQYPPIPRVTNLSETNPVTAGVGLLVLPFASTLAINEAARTRAGTAIDVVARSGEGSWRREGFMLFDPMKAPTLKKLETDEGGPFPLAATITGTIPSFYAGKPIPVPMKSSAPTPGMPPGMTPPPTSMPAPPEDATRVILPSTAEGRIFVIGDGEFITDQAALPTNQVAALNLIDWLARDLSLTSLRTKTVNARPLEDGVEATDREAIKWSHRIGLVALLIGFGIVRWRWRETRRKTLRAGEGARGGQPETGGRES